MVPREVCARIERVERHKNVTLAWCRDLDGGFLAVFPRALGARPRPGSNARLGGTWHPVRDRRADQRGQELWVETCDVLATCSPARRAWLDVHGAARRRALNARGQALGHALAWLGTQGFTLIQSPACVGRLAAEGAAQAFQVTANGDHAFLPVSNLVDHHRYHAAGLARVAQLSRLYWRQSYNDRFSSNELVLIEYSSATHDRLGLLALTEALLEALRTALEPWGVGLPAGALSGLPVLKYAEVLACAQAAGHDTNVARHVLPRAFDAAVFAALGRAGFWVLDAPAAAQPFYVRTRQSDPEPTGVSLELRLAGCGECGSGSEWNTDPGAVPAAVRGSATASARLYLEALREGLPAVTGFSLGLDRVLMALLGIARLQELMPDALRAQSCRMSRPATMTTRSREPESTLARPLPQRCAASARALGRVLDVLAEQRFVACTTSLFEGSPEPHGTCSVTWPHVESDRGAWLLARTRQAAHARLLSDGLERLFEITPCFDPAISGSEEWWQPAWRLDMAWTGARRADIGTLAGQLLRVLALERPALAAAVDELLSGDLPWGQAGALAPVGSPADSFEWRWQARALLGGGVWWQAASDLADDARLRAWAELGLPPAGGLSLVVSHLPAFEWGGSVSP